MMLRTFTLPLSVTVQETAAGERLELSRLLAAAVVNPCFASLLLTDPQAALQQGCEGEFFLLAPQERDLLLSLRAASLAELAGILVRTLGECPHPSPLPEPMLLH
jgi:hypothetical protein